MRQTRAWRSLEFFNNDHQMAERFKDVIDFYSKSGQSAGDPNVTLMMFSILLVFQLIPCNQSAARAEGSRARRLCDRTEALFL